MGNPFSYKRNRQSATPPAFSVVTDLEGKYWIGFDSFVPCEVRVHGRRCCSEYSTQSNLLQFIKNRRDGKFVVCPGHREQARLNGYMPM